MERKVVFWFIGEFDNTLHLNMEFCVVMKIITQA
jgi:hypothetical protein